MESCALRQGSIIVMEDCISRRALDMSNEKLYTLSGLVVRVMGRNIFGKLRMRIGWVVNYEIMSFCLILLGGNMLMRTCYGFENMW